MSLEPHLDQSGVLPCCQVVNGTIHQFPHILNGVVRLSEACAVGFQSIDQLHMCYKSVVVSSFLS